MQIKFVTEQQGDSLTRFWVDLGLTPPRVKPKNIKIGIHSFPVRRLAMLVAG